MVRNPKHKKTTRTGDVERLDPRKNPWYQKKLIQEHLARYRFAADYVLGKTVIDLGCGTGYGSKLLTEAGAKSVTGVDIEKDAITYAKRLFSHKNITFLQADAKETQLPSHSADVIVSFETIEHVDDVEQFLTEVKRLLKKQGTFIFSTPNKQTSFGDNPYHVKEFTMQELDQVLSSFENKKYFGQRKVFIPIVRIYQCIFPFLPSPLRILLRFRPWEGYTIRKIKKSQTVPFLYLLIVCQTSQK